MAAAGFRTRKIKSEQSIGDRLKRARIRRKISVAEVEEATKIRAKFILALESDSWDQIPSEVYGMGYLEAYSEFLKLPVDHIMRDYDRSRTAYSRRCQDSQVELMPKSKIHIPRFLLTPRFALVAVLAIGMLAFGGVVWNQLKQITAAPFLKVETAQAHDSDGVELVLNTDTVTISGQTAMGATVNINGTEVPVSNDGSFSAPVHVRQGVNAVEVVATNNSNGKVTKDTRTIVVH
jgi:cytoskeletal protein RodZ